MSYPGSLADAKSTIKSLETNAHATQSGNTKQESAPQAGKKSASGGGFNKKYGKK